MNVGRVLTLVQEIRELDQTLGVQKRLNNLRASAESLANEPQNQNHQADFVAKLRELRSKLTAEGDRLTTGQREFLEEIGVLDLFTADLAGKIQEQIRDNGIAPSVVKAFIEQAVSNREKVLSNFETLAKSLEEIGVEKDVLQPNEAELGFILPRALFHNHLRELAKEIDYIDKLVRAFFEVVDSDNHSDPELVQLSTSDPLITIATCYAVAVALGKTVTWLLESYKTTLEIKRMRNEAQAAGMKKEVIVAYEEKAEDIIKAAIEARVQQLIALYNGPKERAKELENYLRWGMESLVWRLERGFRVEVRYLPPPKKEEAEAVDGEEPKQEFGKELGEIQAALSYPELKGDPILSLPPSEPEAPKKPRKPRASKKDKKSPPGARES